MLQYVLRRLLQAIPMLIGISFAAFVLMRLAPGGPMAIYAQNPNMSEATCGGSSTSSAWISRSTSST
jgi:ABC-type dipeptide/oligopeptide/nickel transport system permease component